MNKINSEKYGLPPEIIEKKHFLIMSLKKFLIFIEW